MATRSGFSSPGDGVYGLVSPYLPQVFNDLLTWMDMPALIGRQIDHDLTGGVNLKDEWTVTGVFFEQGNGLF